MVQIPEAFFVNEPLPLGEAVLGGLDGGQAVGRVELEEDAHLGALGVEAFLGGLGVPGGEAFYSGLMPPSRMSAW